MAAVLTRLCGYDRNEFMWDLSGIRVRWWIGGVWRTRICPCGVPGSRSRPLGYLKQHGKEFYEASEIYA